MEAQNKKPIFKVGIVHHKWFSPPVSFKVPKRLTPVTAKRLAEVPKSTGKRRLALIAHPAASFAPLHHTFTITSNLLGIPHTTAAGSADFDEEEFNAMLQEPWPHALQPSVDRDDRSQRSSFGKTFSVRPTTPLRDAEDCTTSTPEATMPLTRCSRKVSLLGDTSSSTVPQTSDDLISFESPSP